ncbi:hypothetical protein GCM10020218_008550 [Dactylosporangium vinaceum]
MPKVYALLVGIDRYRAAVRNLQGCVNDIRLAEQLLRDRIDPVELSVLTLCDEQATRAAIIRGFRDHLGAAGPDDTALFWFSGHGSTGPLPPRFRLTENAGTSQTLVCHDSRAGASDLYDKELAVLVREVLARGARLVSIQDSCHARSGLRGSPTGREPRSVPPAQPQPTSDDLLPADPAIGFQAPGHVALSACNEFQLANEAWFTDGVHGVFSEAVLHTLGRIGPSRNLPSDARRRPLPGRGPVRAPGPDDRGGRRRRRPGIPRRSAASPGRAGDHALPARRVGGRSGRDSRRRR